MRELTRFGLAVQRGVHFGGNANNGANAGLVCVNSNNAPSNTNANYGSRQYFTLHSARTILRAQGTGNSDLASWQKISNGSLQRAGRSSESRPTARSTEKAKTKE